MAESQLDKFYACAASRDPIARFLDWLRNERDLVIAQPRIDEVGRTRYRPISTEKDIAVLICEYHGLDYDQLVKEMAAVEPAE